MSLIAWKVRAWLLTYSRQFMKCIVAFPLYPILSGGVIDWPLFLVILQNSSISELLGVARDVKDESDVLIECRDVHKSFGEKQILRGVNFKVRNNPLKDESDVRVLFQCLYYSSLSATNIPLTVTYMFYKNPIFFLDSYTARRLRVTIALFPKTMFSIIHKSEICCRHQQLIFDTNGINIG